MIRIILFLLVSCLSASAQTGQPIKQSGSVTPSHALAWTTNGIAQDAGTAAVPFLTSIGTVGQGQTICAWSALSTAPGSQKICFGVSDSTGASLVIQNFGIDAPKPFSIVLNGTTYQFPYTVGGIVGPSTTVIGDVAIWNNTTGTLLADSGFKPRIRLTSDQTFYVNGNNGSTATCGVHGTSAPLTCSAGSDSNNCLTPGTACLTSQHVVNLIYSTYDMAGFAIFINGAHCSSASCGTNLAFNIAQGTQLGNATINFVGDYDNPTAVEIFAPNGNAAIRVDDQATISIDSIACADQGSATACVLVAKFAQADLRSVTLAGTWNTGATGLAAGGQASLLNLLGVGNGGITNTIASTSIGQIFSATNGGAINFSGQTIAIPSAITTRGGQPTIFNDGGLVSGISSGTFTGSGVAGTTGARCVSFDAYWGNVDPNTVFPGNSNCAMNRTYNSATIVGPTTGGGTAALFAGSDTIAGKSVANGGTGASAAGATAVGNISGATPVSCPGGITAGTVVVLNGIVTHC